MNLARNEILLLVGVFKILPFNWFTSFGDTKFRQRINRTIGERFLKKAKAKDELDYIILEKKGFERVKTFLSLNYEFKGSNSLSRVDTIHRIHHRMIFHFLIDWINKYATVEISRGRKKNIITDFDKYNIEEIFTDYEPDKCRFAFRYSGYEIDLRPDMLLRPSRVEEETLICLEADTSTMNVGRLYDKIIRYCMLAQHEFEKMGIQKLKLYFSFQSQRRNDSVFKYPKELKSNGLIYPMFNQGLVQKYVSAKSKAQIRTLDLMKVLKDGKIEIYSGIERCGLDGYSKIDLFNNIVEVCDRVETSGILKSLEN